MSAIQRRTNPGSARTDRRVFLKQAAATAIILGVPSVISLAWDDEEQSDPLADALARAKEELKPVLVILIPKNDAASTLVDDLAGHLALDRTEAHPIFCEAVAVVLTKDAAAKKIAGFPGDWGLALLEADGKLIEAAEYEFGLYREKFVPVCAGLLHGKDGERLKARAEMQRKVLGSKTSAAIDNLIQDLASESYQVREAATDKLSEVARRATAVLACAHQTAEDVEAKVRIQQTFEKIYNTAATDKPGVRLPFGYFLLGPAKRWHRDPIRMVPRDPCPACGMGVILPQSRGFLRWLTGRGG